MKTYKTIVSFLILLTVVFFILPTPAQATATSNSFQRKTWYDGTRYWRAYNDTANSRIRFDYSTDGTSWTENTSARIAVNTSDFSIEADSTYAFVVYASNNDIKGRAATSYPGTGFGWGTEVTVYTGGGPAGPVGWWKLNENTGTTTSDSSGHGVTGTFTNSPTWTTGKYGSAVNTNSARANVDLGDPVDGHLDFGAASNFSYMAWINSSVAASMDFIFKDYGNGNPGYRARFTTDGRAACDVSDGTSFQSFALGSASIDDGAWHHVACVVDGTNSSLSGYLDGVHISPDTLTANGSHATDHHLEIGIDSATLYFQGSIDDVRIYNYVRTQAQITEDMNNSNPVSGTYSYPVITKDSSGHVWVAARFTDSSVYYMEAIEHTTTNALPQDSSDTVYSLSDTSNTNSNVYGVIVPLTSRQMYAVWVRGTAIEGKKYSSSWDSSATSIATGKTGITNSISAVSDSSGYVHLLYIDSSGHTVYREYTSSWQTAVTFDANSGNSYPTIAINTANSDLYAFWIRGSHIYYKKGVSPYASGNWDASATDWKTTGTNVDVTSDYSASGTTFALWYNGSAVQWDDIGGGAAGCSGVPLSGNYTVTGTCTFSGNVDGVDSGTGTTNTAILSIGTAGTPGYLTVLSNQIIAASSISLVNGSLTIIKGVPGAKIWPHHPLYYTDADGDGYPDVNSTTKSATPSSTVARRGAGLDYNDASTAVHPGATCNGNCSINNTDGTCTAVSAGENGLAACNRCNGSSLSSVTVTDNTQDTEGSNTCSSTCKKCSSGSCINQTAVQDLFSTCSAYTCTGKVYGWSGTSCKAATDDTDNGMCNGSGACTAATFAAGCTSGSTLASCGSSGCVNASACVADSASTTSDTVAEVCYTSLQHTCSSGYICNASGTCIVAATPTPTPTPTNTGPKFPGTIVSTGTWTNYTTAILGSNDASRAITTSATSDIGVSRNYDFSAIPANATINGVVVELEMGASGGVTYPAYLKVRITKDGGSNWSNYTAEQSSSTSTDAVYTYGSSSDLWGLALTAANVKDTTNFRVDTAAWAGGGKQCRVDYLTVTVWYTP